MVGYDYSNIGKEVRGRPSQAKEREGKGG